MPAGSEPILAVDTSVAVPLVMRNHPSHGNVTSWRAHRSLSLCGHAWIETYAVLTRLPGTSRVVPGDAVRLLDDQFDPPIWPAFATCGEALRTFSTAGIAGGQTYDAWIALAARDCEATLVSRDARAEPTYRRLGVHVEMIP